MAFVYLQELMLYSACAKAQDVSYSAREIRINMQKRWRHLRIQGDFGNVYNSDSMGQHVSLPNYDYTCCYLFQYIL